jgi:hypothetical protein
VCQIEKHPSGKRQMSFKGCESCRRSELMTRKRQPSDKVQHGHSKANLGQKEAKLEKNDTELERLREEQLRHMEGGKAAKSAQQQKTKAESK